MLDIRSIVMLALVLGSAVTSVSAQVAGEADVPAQSGALRLTLDEALARAYGASEEVRIAEAERAIAESQIVQARSGALPQVDASVAYTRTIASIFDDIDFSIPGDTGSGGGGATSLPFGRTNVWVVSLQLAQTLYAGGRLRAALNVARHVREAADLNVIEARADVALRVRTAYFQAVLANLLVSIAEESYALADQQLDQVLLLFEQGTASEFEALSARVDRDNLEPAIVEARNARRVAELDLKRLINVPTDQPIELVTPLEPLVGEVDREAIEAALDRRPALRSLDAIVASRESAVRIARAGYLPTVGASANFGYQAFPSSPVPIGADWRRDWSLGFQVTVPLFDGFRTRGEVRQASAELVQAELERDQLRQDLDVEFGVALGEFDEARAQIEARRSTVEEARRALELAELRYQMGLGTQLEVSDARLGLDRARVNEVQALYDYLSALARLERVTGGEIPLVARNLP